MSLDQPDDDELVTDEWLLGQGWVMEPVEERDEFERLYEPVYILDRYPNPRLIYCRFYDTPDGEMGEVADMTSWVQKPTRKDVRRFNDNQNNTKTL